MPTSKHVRTQGESGQTLVAVAAVLLGLLAIMALVGWFAYGSVAGVSGLMDGHPRQFGLQLAAAGIAIAPPMSCPTSALAASTVSRS